MKKEMVLKNSLVTLLALLCFAAVSIVIISSISKRQSMDNVMRISEIYKSNLSIEHTDYADYTTLSKEAKKSMRVTVVALDNAAAGEVLSDSHGNTQEAYIHSLPEIISAIEGNPQAVIRYSKTFSTERVYYAFTQHDEWLNRNIIVQLSVDANSIDAYVLSSIPIIIGLIIAVVTVSIVFTLRLNKNILKAFKIVEINLNRINKGTYKMVLPTFRQEEINRAVIGLNDIQKKIKENIERLSNQSQKLDHVLENTEEGIIAVDSELNIIMLNAYAKSIFDVESDLSGKNLLYLGCDKKFYDNINSAITGGSRSFETTLRNKIYSVKVNGNADNAISAVILLSDITALKRMESLRSDFFANASHELKTPLTSIVGFSELLEKVDDIDTSKKYAAYILRDSKRMLDLIEDMLKLSELDSRIDNSPKSSISLETVAAEVNDNLRIMAEDKSVTVTIRGSGTIYGVRDNIYELLENLMSNAIRYNQSGGKVDVEIEQKGKKVRLTVTDTGIGIENKHHSRIFERFYRVDKGRSKQNGGTGLGLSIVKHIVGLYNGSISLESELGKGTKITVII